MEFIVVPSASLNIKSRVDYSEVLISSQSVGVDQLCLQPLMYAQGEDLTGTAVDLAMWKATQVLSRVTGIVSLLSHWAFAFVRSLFICYLLLCHLLCSVSFCNCHKLPVPSLAAGWWQVDHQKSHSDLRIKGFYFLVEDWVYYIIRMLAWLSSPQS